MINKQSFKQVWNTKEKVIYYYFTLMTVLLQMVISCIVIWFFEVMGLTQTLINLVLVIMLGLMPLFIKRNIIIKTSPFELQTKNKELNNALVEARQNICELENRSWSEHELRMLIQDEVGCIGNE